MQAERKLRFDRQKNIAHIRLEGPLSEHAVFTAFIAAALTRIARHSARFPPGVRDVKARVGHAGVPFSTTRSRVS